MDQIHNYKDIHRGKTAAVLCGGTSLPHDLDSIPEVDHLIGVNQHAMILPLDYLVFSDRDVWDIVSQKKHCKFITHLNKYNLPNVIHAGIWPPMGYSGQRAIYAADYLGFEEIYICGMDQYDQKGNREYWWEGPQCKEMQRHSHCKSDLRRVKEFIDTLQHPERIFFASGRLKEIHQ